MNDVFWEFLWKFTVIGLLVIALGTLGLFAWGEVYHFTHSGWWFKI